MKCPTCLDGTAEYVPNEPPSTGYVLRACEGCRAGQCDDCGAPADPADSAFCQDCANERYLRDGEATPRDPFAIAKQALGRDPLDDGQRESFEEVTATTGDTYKRFNRAWWEAS